MSRFTPKQKIVLSCLAIAALVAVGALIWSMLPSPTPQEAMVQTTTQPPETTTPPHTPPPADQNPDQTNQWDNLEEDLIDNRPPSVLTGLPIDDEYLHRRPFAVVINNIHEAQPQSGIASADIIYEVLSEGDITRLVAIFQSYVPEQIGPVRSTRDYFADFALNHDAIFLHHGGSPTGYSHIRNTGIPNLDGMQLEGTVFWRDRTYPTWHRNHNLHPRRPLEHSSYTSHERIYNHLSTRNIRTEIGENPAFGFQFGQVPTGEGTANTIAVPFSSIYVRTFTFDPDTGLYMVSYQHGPHLDALNQEQIAVANVLVQFVTKRVVGPYGRRAVGTIGEGRGYLATGGHYQPLRWVKQSPTAPMRWYFEDGEPLVLAPGVTWINVFQSNGEVTFE